MSTTQTNPFQLYGRTVNAYELSRFIGSGAAGHVFEATRDGKRFALKIYKDWLFESDPGGQDARISREAAIRRIEHPNVCKVFESGHAILGDGWGRHSR